MWANSDRAEEFKPRVQEREIVPLLQHDSKDWRKWFFINQEASELSLG